MRNALRRYGISAALIGVGIALGGVLLGNVTAEGTGSAATPGATPVDQITPVPVWPTPTPEGFVFIDTLPSTGTGSSRD